MVRLADGAWLTMAQARRLYPDFDLTRSWALPAVAPLPEDETLEAYLRRIGFTSAQLDYARRSWVNAAGEAIDRLSAIAALQDMRIIPVEGDSFYGSPLPSSGDGDYRIAEGYDRLHEWLARGLEIRLNAIVEVIEWGERGVAVRLRGGEIVRGDRAIVTVPLGVLKAGVIRFEPALPADKQAAIEALQMGPALKLVYRFAAPPLPGVWAIYSALNPPMWWTPQPDATGEQVWTAFATGDYARALLAEGEQAALAQGLKTLRAELGQPALTPLDQRIINWAADPFALGGYSSVPPGAVGAREVLARPIGDRLFFAGEAAAPHPWAATVHGAYMTGRRAAHAILSAGVERNKHDSAQVSLQG